MGDPAIALLGFPQELSQTTMRRDVPWAASATTQHGQPRGHVSDQSISTNLAVACHSRWAFSSSSASGLGRASFSL